MQSNFEKIVMKVIQTAWNLEDIREECVNKGGPVEDHGIGSCKGLPWQYCQCQSGNDFELIDEYTIQKLQDPVSCMKKSKKQFFLLGFSCHFQWYFSKRLCSCYSRCSRSLC